MNAEGRWACMNMESSSFGLDLGHICLKACFPLIIPLFLALPELHGAHILKDTANYQQNTLANTPPCQSMDIVSIA